MPAKTLLFIGCFPVLVDARSWSQVTVRVRAGGTWRPCYNTVFEDPGAVGLPRPQPLAPGVRPMGLTPGENLANPRHISYHLPWKLGHVPNYFVNIQGAVRE